MDTGSRLTIQPRHFGEFASAFKAPPMERTGDSIPTYATADAQVGSQVRAVSIKDPSDSVLTPEEYEIPSEVGHWPNVAWS
jgi:hypothetical protein